MNARSAFAAVAMVAAAWALNAAEPTERQTRRPWEWKLEERLEMRLDPVARAARINAHVRERGGNPGRINDALKGDRPELYLPHELFDKLIRKLEDREKGQFPFLTPERLRANGFDDATFWEQLAIVVAPVREARKREREYVARFANASVEELYAAYPAYEPLFTATCRAAFDALAHARNHFGAVKFDRFLYNEIAANSTMLSFEHGPTLVDYETLHRMLAEGCR
jgi:hypothetical protein